MYKIGSSGGGVKSVKWREVGGQAVLGRPNLFSTPWVTERNGQDHIL